MTILYSISMALSMFTRIPMPQINWEKANMKYMMAAFPLIGVVIGVLIFVWSLICEQLELGTFLYAAGLTLLPVLITGGIHLDGYCDTIDALASHAPPERKRAILKDPNAGAFAVIYLGFYLLAYFSLCTEGSHSIFFIVMLGSIAVMSRAAAGIASLTFPTSKGGGILDTYRDASSRISLVFCIIWFLLPIASFIVLFINNNAYYHDHTYVSIAGVLTFASMLLCMIYVRVMSKRQFGGMSGDLAGFLVQTIELVALAVLIFTLKAVN